MRLIDADAFVEFLRDVVKKQKYDDLKIDEALTVADVIDAVISELEGTSLDGFTNAPTIGPEPKWIPCSERLPEPRMDVWACSDIGQIQGYYEEHVGIWYASFGQGRDYLELYVTAWMPLPEPYQGEGREE